MNAFTEFSIPSKVGILLAYALMTVIIHNHNSTVKASHTKPLLPLCCKYCKLPESPTGPQGFLPKFQEEANGDSWEIDILQGHLDMQIILPLYNICIQKYQMQEYEIDGNGERCSYI